MTGARGNGGRSHHFARNNAHRRSATRRPSDCVGLACQVLPWRASFGYSAPGTGTLVGRSPHGPQRRPVGQADRETVIGVATARVESLEAQAGCLQIAGDPASSRTRW
jgi:hypothetical protein